MNLNETLKNNLIFIYKKNKKTFRLLSYSTASKTCSSDSEEYAIDGDNLKLLCCSHSRGIKSIDAITYNKRNEFLFIEFKIQKHFHEDIINDLSKKFTDTFICFQHNIDKKHEISFDKIKCFFVFNIRRETDRNIRNIKRIKKKLNNKVDELNKEHRISLNFKIIYSSTFDHSIDYFKMDDYFSEVK
ncbi:hypothetical protein [Spiroplasma endosymbiont of Danaus chrysippus]|uniref:hypothetical protein n=1 Tax=Spiroplasma endosymbiont of Danaus chrysippus TaxID=2691041 RepID=UPI00157A845C|nr:hypothetical protein [Spiroplasma endosymbiont of Danaus chrysippus]